MAKEWVSDVCEGEQRLQAVEWVPGEAGVGKLVGEGATLALKGSDEKPLGVIVAEVLFARRRGIPLLPLADLVAVAVPIGLFFGRIANFINGELYGRPTDVAWAMVFPHSDGQPRHPSQLYEAALEGVLLFVVLFLLARRPGGFSRPGFLTGVFLIGYGLSRILVELAREPDAVPGYLFGGTTMGQWLSVPMLLGGAWLLWHARHAPAPQPK